MKSKASGIGTGKGSKHLFGASRGVHGADSKKDGHKIKKGGHKAHTSH